MIQGYTNTLHPSLELCDEPVHALHEAQARERAASHDLPLALAQVREPKCFRHLSGREAALSLRQILLVGEDEEESRLEFL